MGSSFSISFFLSFYSSLIHHYLILFVTNFMSVSLLSEHLSTCISLIRIVPVVICMTF
jgi:hypothetical protein